jgi:hypothetical protein
MKEYNFFTRAKNWISNKLTELSIAQIPDGYSEDDNKLLKKYYNVLWHIRDKNRRLTAAKMLESQNTQYHIFNPLASEEIKEVEVKNTKTQQIMDFLTPPKTVEEIPLSIKKKWSIEDYMIAIREGREMEYLISVEEREY